MYINNDAHEQGILGNGAIILHHEIKHASRWYYRVQEVKIEQSIVYPWHNVHTKFHAFTSSHSLVIKFVQTIYRCQLVRLGQVWLG
jgi:hypothetical protein